MSYSSSSKYWKSSVDPSKIGVVDTVPPPLPPLNTPQSKTPTHPRRLPIIDVPSSGELINGGFDPIKENVYSNFTEYFNNPKLIKKKDVDQFSMYITRVQSMLSNEYRFIVVLIQRNNEPVGSMEELQNLKWVSIQTRTFQENQKTLIHSYQPRRFAPLMKKIRLTSKNEESCTYKCDELPLIITLLKKEDSGEYNPTGVIPVALETYQTIVSFTE